MVDTSTVLKNAVDSINITLAFNQPTPPYNSIITSMRVIVTNHNEVNKIKVKSVTNTNNKNKNRNSVQSNTNKTSIVPGITDPSKLPKGDLNGHIRYDKDQKGRPVEINFLISYPKPIWMQLTTDQQKLIASKAREYRNSKPHATT